MLAEPSLPRLHCCYDIHRKNFNMDESSQAMEKGSERGLSIGADGKSRCGWVGSTPEYVAYHDREWGVPIYEEHGLYERIMLEAFQSGLAWITILRKREGIRDAFCQFDADAVAVFDDTDVARLMQDTRIIRNRRKIEAAITNAQATVALRAAGGLSELVWSYAPLEVRIPQSVADIPASTAESIALAKALKKAGFVFVGPTTMYAAMQAMGMVNDHLADCHVRSRT